MIKKLNSAKKCDNNKKLSAILRDGQGPRWQSYYLRAGVKLVAVLAFSDFRLELKDSKKASFQLMKKIYRRHTYVRKFIKMVAKECSTMAVTRKTNPNGTLRASCVKDYSDFEFPWTIILLADYKGKFLLKRRSVHQREGGLKENSTSSLGDAESEFLKVEKSKFKDVETLEDELRGGHNEEEAPLRYISFQHRDQLLPKSALGWPLHGRTASTSHAVLRTSEERNISVVQWVMTLPNRSRVGNSTAKEPEIKTSEDEIVLDESWILRDDQEEEVSSSSVSFDANESPKSRPGWPLLLISVPETLDSSSESETAKNEIILVPSRQPANELELISLANSSDCRIFKHEELKTATSLFSSENLIGEGGCSSVYIGCLSGGKSVAVKVLKPYKEAWTDFSLEVNIVSSIKHKHITPLIGICLENGLLISVYDYFPKGSLDNYLHGDSTRHIMPWKERFNVAIAVAEALNYLHGNCPQPVIHRDVKPSNILLTNELQPQLSDFGLAIWGSSDSAYSIESDVVGTFGYIAPEYFMYGMISEKVDVYAFGVVLLELLSGKKPIGAANVPKGQESLVKWAKNLLEKGEHKALVDPKLKGDIDVTQMQRMVLAARLCISHSARVRPKVIQILELLKGEGADVFAESHMSDSNDDDFLVEFGCRDRPSLAILDESISRSCKDGDALSLSSEEKTHRFKLRDFLNQRQD
ncbi:Serine/threonine protein kinase [Parasponia andersonii]|uniref:Serine/threonine protein kinase n=1 Tax=Parasponia andersonii TaxID=3476 RepID=A0A2P5DJE6_PARAD|nr:Serine/threonine protein kinase [Parasponia andersonii]